jgi:hypothetical protein
VCAPGFARRWRSVAALIAISYLWDGAILALIAVGGLIKATTALGYVTCGLACCGATLGAGAAGWLKKLPSPRITLAQIAASILLQLVYVAAVPELAVYFLAVLCVILAYSATVLAPRQAAVLWLLMSVAVIVIFVRAPPDSFVISHASAFAQALMGGCAGRSHP